MNIIYDGSTAQKIRNILKREDIYVTMDVEGNCPMCGRNLCKEAGK